MKINEYPLEQLTFQDEAYYDIDFFTGSGYETKKILGSVIKAGIQSGMVDIVTYNGDLLAINSAIAGKFDNPTGDNTQYLDGAGVPTPFPTIPVVPLEKHFAFIDAENMTNAGGGTTWNGVPNITSPATVTVNQRYKFKAFAFVGQPDGVYFNSIIPTFFQLGNTLKISMVWTSQDIGNCAWNIGVTTPTGAGGFGGATSSEWQKVYPTSTGGFGVFKVVLTFSGANFAIGDPMSVMIFRDNSDPLDTLTGDAYLNTVNVEQS